MAAENAKAQFFDRDIRALTPLDPARAESFLADLAARAGEEELTGVVALLRKAEAARFLSAVLDLSPFIREALTRHPRILDRIVAKTPEAALKDILSEISASAASDAVTEASLMTSLRVLKREAHVLIALCDLAGNDGGSQLLEYCLAQVEWPLQRGEAA